MFVACGIWCLADVSSVSPSSEQTVCSREPLEMGKISKSEMEAGGYDTRGDGRRRVSV